MKTEDMNKEFKRAYKSLVDTVEELVVKDGKSLQQAMHTAEERLSEWNNLNKKQVEEISTELTNNFHTLGESLKGAREAYKEQFQLDAAYVNDSIWDKLLKVMDANTAQLLVFEEDLKERAQAATSKVHLTEHQQHTQWKSDHELWLAEIALWKKEHDTALAQLADIEKTIKQHSDALDEHAQAVQAHEASDHEHEKTIANAEKDPSNQVFEESEDKEASVHKQEAQEHRQHAELHDTMKKSHLKMMASVAELYKKVV